MNRFADILGTVARLLQVEDDSFPAVLQRVLAVLEESGSARRVTLTLAGGRVVVSGRPVAPSSRPPEVLPLVRGTRPLGTLSWESGPEGDPGQLSPEEQQAFALLIAQEIEVRRLGRVLAPATALIGSSGVMQEVLRLVEKAAGSKSTVLLLGEPGVGKVLLAEVLHRRSAEARGPFVAFQGTALPESMVESELFGPALGSEGKFGEARGGTLLLAEVGNLSVRVQTRLLSALGEAGAPRLVATSSRSLESLAAAGRLHQDLQERLAALPIQVPPLRERGSDIIALADHFVTGFSLQTGKTIKRISTPTLEMLLTYPWPGNVRELETVIERAVLLSDDEVIHGYHLPPSLQSSVHSGTRMHGRLADRLDSLEYEMLVEALKASRGNITQAARELGLTKRIMGLRLGKFELDYRTFRQAPGDLVEEEDWN